MEKCINFLTAEIPIFLLWIGVWGFADNVINTFVPYESHKTRLMLFAIIIAVALLYIYKNDHKNLNNSPFTDSVKKAQSCSDGNCHQKDRDMD